MLLELISEGQKLYTKEGMNFFRGSFPKGFGTLEK